MKIPGCSSLVDYEIVQQCGSGTYGSVYRAIHKNSRQVVALKKVSKFPMEDGFPVECKYLQQLGTSKNVVNMFEYFFAPDGQLVLVFEYMETDLWKCISGPNANVPLLQTKCIMKQLFEGLTQCHAAGIMHRDVKPSNLLFNANGIMKLADFGLTTSFVKPPYLSNNVVSLYYRPPELLMGSHDYGPEIDMWSAGCILVELLTNNYLFAGVNESDQLNMIFQVFGTPDEGIWPGVSQLPGWGLVESGKQHPSRDLHDNYQSLETNVLDLASRLLQLDPKKRITSYEALHHPWFTASPLPCTPNVLPTLWKNNPKFKAKLASMEAAANKLSSSSSHYSHNNYNNNNNNYASNTSNASSNNIWRKDDSYYPSSYEGYYNNGYNNQAYDNSGYYNNGYNNGFNGYNNGNYGGSYNNNSNYYYNNPPANYSYEPPQSFYSHQNYYPPNYNNGSSSNNNGYPYYNNGYNNNSGYQNNAEEYNNNPQNGYGGSYYDGRGKAYQKGGYYGDSRRNNAPRYTHSQL